MNTRSNRVGIVRSLFGDRLTRPSRRVRRGRPARIEGLEPRAMFAADSVVYNPIPIVVTLTSDSAGYNPGELRWAINEANTIAGPDRITFAIPGVGPQIIKLSAALDSIQETVEINGSTQPGYLATPIVDIDGSLVADVGFRITAAGSNSTIKALSIYGFVYDASNGDSGNAIVIDGSSDGNLIESCFLGTNYDNTGSSNAVAGVLVRGANTLLRGNVISNNSASGVILENDTDTTLVGNRIGIDREGNALPNADHGVLLRDSSGTRIGGVITAERNIISGNVGDGIHLDGASTTTIVGNYIGVDAFGADPLANFGVGISLDATDTIIGNGTVGGRNVIGGNEKQGIVVRNGSGTQIAGNFIGVAASGAVSAGNVLAGVQIDGGTNHVVGGTAAGQGNLISGNSGDGVRVTGEALGVLVQQNLIGLGTTLAALPNGGDGVSVYDATNVTVTFRNRVAYNLGAGIRLSGASGNFIGADDSQPAAEQGIGFGNAIYANGLDGIRLEAEANDNVIAANLVGLATPNGAIQGNGGDGIAIQASRRNLVGGVRGTPVFANLVVGNVSGISITNSDALDYAANGGDGNTVRGNEVRNNSGHGIVVDDAAYQLIGGITADAANTITLNGGNGIDVRNGSRAIKVSGNYVGTNSAGQLGFGNGGVGIRVLQSNASVIGGDSTKEGNLVVGNGSDGVVITRVDDSGVSSGDARENEVYGNFVRANRGNGIRITTASDNTIGQADTGYGNLVGNNALDGLRIETSADGNRVFGNVLGGAAVLGNGGVGIRITASYENLIGEATLGAGNAISRNLAGGIVIDQSDAIDLFNGNVVVGNLVDANLGHGIQLTGSSFQTIGGELGVAGAANIVTRNRGVGIRLTTDAAAAASPSDENLIQSNLVGTTDADTTGLGNTSHGVEIVKGSYNVLLGNTIARNSGAGVRVDGGLTEATAAIGANNTIGGTGEGEGNSIRANLGGGVLIENGARRDAILGGVIDGNTGAGVQVRGGGETRIGGGASVVRSTGDGILVTSQRVGGLTLVAAGTLIEDVYVGTNAADDRLGNQGNGVRLSGAAGVTVGSGVVTAFNRQAGVRIENSTANSLAEGNVVRAADVRGNSANGIVVAASAFQTIGGTTDGFGNRVSANTTDGIALTSQSRSILVQGNEVTANTRHGISLASTNDSTISGSNLVIKNGFDGVNVSASSARNLISGNTIGDETDPTLGNARDGIGLYAVTTNSVTDNVVAGNARHGLTISGAVAGGTTTTNVVQGNRLIANGQNGVTVLASRNQVIGGTGVDQENTIGLNKADGVFVGGLSASVVVIGNLIGIDAAGGDLGNMGDGIEVNNALGTTITANSLHFNDGNGLLVSGSRGTTTQPTLVNLNDVRANDVNGVRISASSGVLVGGAANGNVIGLNARAGIRIDGASTANIVEANRVGTDADGADTGNVEDGILITGSLGNVIRGGNTVSFNGVGVRILDAAATKLADGNRIESNLLTENDAEGVVIAGAAFHTVGGSGLGNTITLNGGDGVSLRSSGRNLPVGNLVRGNLIGTDAAQLQLGNAGNGVRISGGSANIVDQNTVSDNGLAGVVVAGSSSNVVGSITVGKGNRIVGNGSGVEVTDAIGGTTATTRGNVVTGNTITHSVGDGVTVSGSKTVATVIGMTSASGAMSGQGNAIRDNVGVGISLQNAAQQVSMQGNSIVDNAGGAIDRRPGTNVGAATPQLTSVQRVTPSRGVTQLAVRGSLTGVAAGQQYQIDVFSSKPEDGNGDEYGGRTYLGRATVAARSAGTLAFAIQVPAGVTKLGDFVTVMATNLRPPANTSSAFSTGRPVVIASPTVSAAAFAALSASPAPGGTTKTAARRVVVPA